ncbi:MAG TPA: LLM class F420-dependent oxidoreductase [Dermatophilaceae bacterium]|jgi:probable F420-dependent oxidoreductase
MRPWEICLPSRGVSPHDALHLACLLEDVGYGGIWATEVAGHDAVALLAAIATQTSRVRLGTAIIPSATRSPALLAMGAATLAHLAPGRSTVGLGVSSPGIIQEWHGRTFASPLSSVSDALSIIQQAFSGEVTEYHGRAFSSRGFTLQNRPDTRPDFYLAALGPAMRGLATERFDGVILNFLPRSRCEEVVEQVSPSRRFEVTTLVRVSVEGEASGGVSRLRKELASYLRFEQYSRWLAGLGYGDAVTALHGEPGLEERAAQVPDDLLQDVSVIGNARSCRAQLEEMCAAGVTPLVIPDVPVGDMIAMERVIRAIAPVKSSLARTSALENAG